MNNQYNLRLSSLFFLFVSLYIIVLGNLYILQIRQTQFFSNLGNQQYHVNITQLPPRAEIVDRFNQPLAMNKDNIAAFIIPRNLEQPELVISFLKAHFPQAADRLEKNRHAQFQFIKRRLTPKQLELIQSSNLNDIKLLKEPSRYYPVESVGPLVGMTDIDNQGLFGIELLYNLQLAGKATTYILEKDAKHYYFKRETKIEGKFGQQVQLSIDGMLQFLVYEELKEAVAKYSCKEGAVLIIDPSNGEILVMANYPDFDPNTNDPVPVAQTKNKIFTDAHELGSVIKIFLALAALEEQVTRPEELIDCENSTTITLNGRKFTTYKANGIISFTDVMVNSNNLGVAKIALRLGPKLYEHYTRLRFGQKIGIFPGENKGFITPVKNWSNASIISLSFGYEISVTLMQLAQALSIIANNGYLITPQLKKNFDKIYKTGPLYKPESIQAIKKILSKTAKVAIPDVEIMGKTGTARLLTNGIYDPTRHIFTYAAIIKKGHYQRIIITCVKDEMVQNGMMASTTALPLFEQVAHKMLIHDKIR